MLLEVPPWESVVVALDGQKVLHACFVMSHGINKLHSIERYSRPTHHKNESWVLKEFFLDVCEGDSSWRFKIIFIFLQLELNYRHRFPLRNATVTKEGRGSLTKVFQVQLLQAGRTSPAC